MELYALTLQSPGSIRSAAYGNFTSPKAHEVAVIRGTNVLELLRPDEEGRLRSICRQHRQFDLWGV